MIYKNLETFMEKAHKILNKGPVAIVVIEDNVEIASTLRHNQQLGFKTIIALMPEAFDLPPDLSETIHRVNYINYSEDFALNAINQIITAAPNLWMYYCYNAEYLYFPFCETRRIGDMLAFHAEERRDAMLCYVIDMYSPNLKENPNGVCTTNAHFDATGYYALGRKGDNGQSKERQLDFFGGLRWRFEEHVPKDKRRIDRIALFKAKKNLSLLEGHVFDDEEYNTYACPWHNNLTAAICSFRAAKALKTNPYSSLEITSFLWHKSTLFDWHSNQLLDLGLMEPGQWF